jgi:vesicle coat complex subunit
MKRDIVLAASVVVFLGCGKTETVEYTVPTLTKSLMDKDPNMRYWAAESLGHFGRKAKAAVPALVEALHDEDTNVRMGAAYALAEIAVEAKDALPPLRQATKDPEKAVRAAAAYAVRKVQGRR